MLVVGVSVVGVATRPWAGPSGVRILVRVGYFSVRQIVQTGPGATLSSAQWALEGSSRGVKLATPICWLGQPLKDGAQAASFKGPVRTAL
jgi:hypothetical protein